MESLTSTLLGSFLSFILLYKYTALFVIEYAAAIAIPLPASATLAAAGAFAAQGYLDISLVLITAFVSNVLGDLTGYFLALRYGEKTFRVIGLHKLLASEKFKSLKAYMLDFPQSVIFITRFLAEVSFIVSVLCGLARVRYRTYLTFVILGEIAYVLLYGLAGYYLGSAWENNLGFLFKAAMAIISVGIALNVLQWSLFNRHRRAKQ